MSPSSDTPALSLPAAEREGEEHLPILHALAPCDAGGLERVVQVLAIGHREVGYDVRVAAAMAPGQHEHPFLLPLRAAGVPVYPLHFGSRDYLRERRAFARLCRQLRPRVVHTHGYRATVVEGGVARSLGIATVATVHGYTGGDARNRFYEWLERWVLRRFDVVVPVSRPLASLLARAGVSRERLHLIPNGWGELSPPFERGGARAALGASDESFLVGWVGRLGREKGLDVLIEALPLLEDLPLTLSVVGDGRERESLQARAAALGWAERVRWLGTVAEAGRLFAGFDLFVLSSRTEGTPIVLFEAMAAAVPIVATRVGGVPDVLSEAEALLVPPEDPAALAAAARSVFADPAAARARAASARDRLHSEFGRDAWLKRYAALYRRLDDSRRTLR
ncbi:MAG TPA: glycosyltransferase [Longimicrobiaceae bacterium]|nr:glycosyltransferase [Longimicrobiaceae bacterium]